MSKFKSPKYWSVGQKLSLTTALIAFSVAFSISFFVLRQEKIALEGELKKRGIEMVNYLSVLSTDLVLHEKIWDLFSLVKDMVRNESDIEGARELVYGMVLNKNGILLTHSDPLHFVIGKPLEKNAVNDSALKTEALMIQTLSSSDGGLLYDLAAPVIVDNQKIGIARIGISTKHLERTIANVRNKVWLISTLMAIIGAMIGLIISRRITKPLMGLTESARAISQERLDEIIHISSKEKDEIGILTDTFNIMSVNLRDRIEELKGTKRFLWNVLENANDFIYMVDLKGNFTFLNQKIEEFGYKKSELINKPFPTILTEKYKRRRFTKTIREGLQQNYEIEIKCKNGEVRSAVLSISPLQETNNKITGILGILRDITDRKKAEEKLFRESQKLDDIVKGIGAGLTIVDINRNVLWANRIIEEWYGPLEKIKGKKCYEIYMGTGKMCESCPTEVSLKDGKTAHNSEKRMTQKGEEREFYITSTPIKDETGKIVQALELVQDVTERKLLENELAKAEKMAVVGEIAAGVAHEIRNPLGSIITALHLLSSENGVKTEDERSALVSVLKNESDRLSKILSDFLNFARPREPKITMNNINLLIEEVLHLSDFGHVGKDEINIKKDLEPEMPVIPIDGDQIKQVLWNIVLNGLQAMKNGGELKIESKLHEKDVQISIADNGTGISDEELEKIFVPFYTDKKGGSGLGLSIAQRIVNSHKGDIEVDSSINEGTRFKIILPISSQGMET